MQQIDDLLGRARELGASDLHLQAGLQPHMRVDGALHLVPDAEGIATDPGVRGIVLPLLSPQQHARLQADRQIDFPHTDPSGCRWRAHCFQHTGGLAATFRKLAGRPPALRELGLPAIVESVGQFHAGLVLIAGATGSGKTTTLAAMVDLINGRADKHIVTVEDPIEYVHAGDRSLIQQREVGTHVPSFAQGLADAVAAGPDILVAGDLRDHESVRYALTAAESGTLVLSTLTASTATTSIYRLIDVFPDDEHSLARAMIAEALQLVVAQLLVPAAGGRGRLPVCEILVRTPAISGLIREEKIHEIPNCIQTGGAQGMCLMDDALAKLVEARRITRSVARAHARNRDRFAPTPGG